MGDFISRLKISLGLYDLRTLMTKFAELFWLNQQRYFHSRHAGMAEPLYSTGTEAEAIPLPPDARLPGGRTIYYLIHCFYPYSQGGTERFIYNLASQAKKEGNRVKVITYNATRPRGHFGHNFSNILYNEYQIDGIEVLEYRHKRAPRGILKDLVEDDQETLAFADRLFTHERPDIVHFGYIQKVSPFVAACRSHGIPYGITFTSFFALCHFDIMIDRQGHLCPGSSQGVRCRKWCPCLDVQDTARRYGNMQRIMQEAAFLAAPSLFVKQMLEKEFDVSDIRIVKHGVSRQLLHLKPAGEPARKKPANFAYIGSLAPIKGVHGLITAFTQLPADYNLNLYGTGNGAYLRKLEKMAAGRDNIFFHGRISFDQMNQVYQDNEVIVVPSIWYETYNFVIHEALLMNKLVIAARIGAMPELIKDGLNGFTFNPGDWADLGKCLQKASTGDLNPRSEFEQCIPTVEAEFAHYRTWYQAEGGEPPRSLPGGSPRCPVTYC